MTDQPKDGGPAFPHPEPRDPQLMVTAPGMTLRDWFAGQALGSSVAASWDATLTVEQNARVGAVWAYCVADAMLEARK